MPVRPRRRMMRIVRWIRGHLVAIALSASIVALLGLETMAAVASPARRGATYEGDGRQPHYSEGRFVLQFRVARNGRQVRELQVPYLDVDCTRDHRELQIPSPVVGSAHIRGGSTFRAVLRDGREGTAVGGPVEFTGRFLSRGRARGTLRYRGRGQYRDCKADGTWTAHVKPPPPPVRRFTGTTEQGTRVTFERTIERHPLVKRFDFGWLRATYAWIGVQCGPVKVAAPLGTEPWWNQFALPVNHRRFSGRYSGFGSIYISGRFDAKDRASGTVSYGDRGDCVTGDVHWTAHPAG